MADLEGHGCHHFVEVMGPVFPPVFCWLKCGCFQKLGYPKMVYNGSKPYEQILYDLFFFPHFFWRGFPYVPGFIDFECGWLHCRVLCGFASRVWWIFQVKLGRGWMVNSWKVGSWCDSTLACRILEFVEGNPDTWTITMIRIYIYVFIYIYILYIYILLF